MNNRKNWSVLNIQEQEQVKALFKTHLLSTHLMFHNPNRTADEEIRLELPLIIKQIQTLNHQPIQFPINELVDIAITPQLGFPITFNEHDIRVVLTRVMLDIYLDKCRSIKEIPYYFFLCNSDELQRFVAEKATLTPEEIILSVEVEQFLPYLAVEEAITSEEQLKILQESFKKVTSFHLAINDLALNNAMEKILETISRLIGGIPHFTFSKGSPFRVTKSSLRSLNRYITAPSLDLTNLYFEGQFDAEMVTLFQEVLLNRSSVQFARGFDVDLSKFPLVLNNLQFTRLELNRLNLRMVLSDLHFSAQVLSLNGAAPGLGSTFNTNLFLGWDKADFINFSKNIHFDKLELCHINLNNPSNELIENLILLAQNAKKVTISDCSIKRWTDAQWSTFCDKIIAQKLSAKIEITDLSADRKQALFLSSLKANGTLFNLTRLYLFNHSEIFKQQPLEALPEELSTLLTKDQKNYKP